VAKSTLKVTAELLVAVEQYLRVAGRSGSRISLQEVDDAGTRWASRRTVRPTGLHPKLSKQWVTGIAMQANAS
jgi:hypothetical protein